MHKKKGLVNIASAYVSSKDSEYLDCKFEDDLDDFKSFTVSLKDGKILSYTAAANHSDLFIDVNEISSSADKEKNSQSAADEFLKWKELLDQGVYKYRGIRSKEKTTSGHIRRN